MAWSRLKARAYGEQTNILGYYRCYSRVGLQPYTCTGFNIHDLLMRQKYSIIEERLLHKYERYEYAICMAITYIDLEFVTQEFENSWKFAIFFTFFKIRKNRLVGVVLRFDFYLQQLTTLRPTSSGRSVRLLIRQMMRTRMIENCLKKHTCFNGVKRILTYADV